MWAALTALFVVMLITIACSVVWITANVIGFLQPILIPVAIAVILAYLLDPLITAMTTRGMGRTKSVLALFAIAFSCYWSFGRMACPIVSIQAASVGRELPQYTLRARDKLVDVISGMTPALGIQTPSEEKDLSTTAGIVNWLLSPTKPTPAVSPGYDTDGKQRLQLHRL
jgi:predicted PurR-regulated permease PerM